MVTMQSTSADVEVASLQHCYFCFEALICHFKSETCSPPQFSNALCPLFVTWNKASGSSGYKLRGCIGTLEPRRVHTALHDYALTSALRDSRFDPIQLREVSSLQCKVSLLSCFEAADTWRDWEVGVHGIIINFADPITGAKRSATFLPEVALDQGWTIQQCVDNLIRKAGFQGHVTDQLRESLKVTRYQSSIASATYADFCRDMGMAEAAHRVAEPALAW